MEDILQTKKMNCYERHMWGEILQWEHENKEGLWNYCTTKTTNAIKSAIQRSGAQMPDSVSSKIKSGIDAGLRTCFSGSLHTTSKTQILERTNQVFDHEYSNIAQLRGLDLEQLDELATSYASTNQILALLEGAGMGLGGALFIAADIPALILINLRQLIQLAYIYGIDANDPLEREYILNVMLLASAEQKEQHSIFCRLDQQAKYNAEAAILSIQIGDNIVNEVMRRMVGTAHRIAIKLSHAKLLQLLPIVGLAIGAGGNYAYSKEITAYGMMAFRKRWLMDKYLMFDEMLQFRQIQDDKLMTSWVLVVDGGEDEDDMEFEEDFRISDADLEKGLSIAEETNPFLTTTPTPIPINNSAHRNNTPITNTHIRNAPTDNTPAISGNTKFKPQQQQHTITTTSTHVDSPPSSPLYPSLRTENHTARANNFSSSGGNVEVNNVYANANFYKALLLNSKSTNNNNNNNNNNENRKNVSSPTINTHKHSVAE